MDPKKDPNQTNTPENASPEPTRSDRSDRSVRSPRSPESPRHLRPSGGYRSLRTFQAATVIYDATVDFCERFLPKSSRMTEQMVQSARSGRQNIAEGSRDAATSSQTELRLVGIARGSLDELLLDYEDFLRQRELRAWTKDDPESLAVRNIGRNRARASADLSDPSDPVAHAALYARWLKSPDPAVVANALICLIHQTNYLLDRQIEALEKQFVQGGGYSEQLAAKRIAARSLQSGRPAAPVCPLCGKPMALRTAKKGRNAGTQFWGCSGYPECKATRNLDDPDPTDPSDPSDQPKGSPSC